ncbi:MAG: hypothetical protein JEZ04_02105 [Spirochaetales bacterium]|nr:hypothetical protein [Spirochaetales bacterium]
MKKPDGKLLVSVAGRITVFLYLFSVLILLLYIQGNFQDFLDASLSGLLTAYKYTALMFISTALSYIFILIFSGRGSSRSVGIRIFLTAAGITLSAAGFFITAILSTAFQAVL